MSGGASGPQDLPAILAGAWDLLEAGVRDRRSSAHTPCVATLGVDGRPRSRIVVLRGADRARRTLRFHTDSRSAKAAEIQRDARVAVLVYDAARKLQIRIEGTASLHAADAFASHAWLASRPASRVCYSILPGPGTPVATADGYAMAADEAGIEGGRENFLAVLIAVDSLETLSLHHDGHRRARFTWRPGGDLNAGWLAP